MHRILSFVLTFQALTLLAQPGVSPTKEVDGKTYYVHTVQSGNTLWGLQQMYHVPAEEIMQVNPALTDGLKVGDEVLIPLINESADNQPNDKVTSKYKVKKGETLYGLSRKFNTNVDELIALNQELQTEGLQKGQWILVPGKYKDEEPIDEGDSEIESVPNPFVVDTIQEETHHEEVAISFSDTTVKHTVLAHETMYSISKRFMVKIDTIMKLNGLKSTTLKEGQILIIPVKQERIDRVNIKPIGPDYDPESNDSIEFFSKDRYKVAVLIPLYLDYGIGYSEYVSSLATQFYMGTKLALDSLKIKGLNADVFYFDTKNDSATVSQILKKQEFEDMDLIIGPFFPKNHDQVAKYAKQNKVRMVCPLASNSSVLENNRLVYASVPSNITLMKGMAAYMLEHNRADNIVLIKPTKESDKALYNAFRDAFNETPILGARPALKETEMAGLKNFIHRGVNTIFVVPTTDNYTAGKMMNTLNRSAFRSKADDLFVYGTKEWITFSDINETYKNKYNFHYPSPNFLDYYSDGMKLVNQEYRKQFQTDMPRMAVQGYDVIMHYCSEFFLNSESFLLMNDVESVQISESDGFENKKVFMIKQEEFELINIDAVKDE